MWRITVKLDENKDHRRSKVEKFLDGTGIDTWNFVTSYYLSWIIPYIFDLGVSFDKFLFIIFNFISVTFDF